MSSPSPAGKQAEVDGPVISATGTAAEIRDLEANYRAFAELLDRARRYLAAGDLEAAATLGEIAALSATWRHSGQFANPELESLLAAIGSRVLPEPPPGAPRARPGGGRRQVLHIGTWLQGLQGLNRLLWRWIEHDRASTHSLAVTGHAASEIPEFISAAAIVSGGTVESFDEQSGSAMSRVQALSALIGTSDLVVLHLQTEDVVPIIALAARPRPTIFINNADHAFWVGVAVSDVLVNLRESGRSLAIARRGIPDRRNALLPILLDRRERETDRPGAKRQLGLDEDSVLLLSIARGPKYKPMGKESFLDLHRPLVEANPNVHLWAIGPEETGPWQAGREATGGRIRAFGPRADTGLFYQAADVYVDSFPIVSITSLLEAGCYEVPLLSMFPYPDDCGVLGADTPALDECLIRARSGDDYRQQLSRLIADTSFREAQGRRTRAAIVKHHFPEAWAPRLEPIYRQALANWEEGPGEPATPAGPSALDTLVPRIFRMDPPFDITIYQKYLRRLPLIYRARWWLEIAANRPYLVTPPAVSRLITSLGIKERLRGLLGKLSGVAPPR